MEHKERLTRAIGEAVAGVIPENAGDFVVGDYVCVAEVLVENGDIGLAIVAPTRTHQHLQLLTGALDQAVNSLNDQTTGGDTHAA